MAEVVQYDPCHLPQLQALVNGHLGAVVPGWALPSSYIADRLRSNPREYIVDPWVVERRTLCAIDRGRVCAAAHLLRYADGPQVSVDYRNAGDLAWFVAWPDSAGAAKSTLSAVRSQMRDWGATRIGIWLPGLPVPLCYGVADAWPHIAAFLTEACCVRGSDHVETVFAGTLSGIDPPGNAPVAGVAMHRGIAITEASFLAVADGEGIAHCEVVADMTLGGELPALAGWAELSSLLVEENWRGRGIGAWLVRHAVAWLRMARCDRIILSVAEEDDQAGAGRFYRRFGWNALTRLEKGWILPLAE